VNLIKGDGVVENMPEALKYLRMGVDGGHKEAQYFYAVQLGLYKPSEMNLQLANSYLLLSAEQGHREAQYVLGANLDIGRGVTPNIPEALKYFRSSADKGFGAQISNIF
jgi:TPR repeat protein